MQEKKTAGQAVASLVLGILSLLICGILTAIPAVICGHIAKSKIKADPENLQGDGQALAGLIMGYITIGGSILVVALMATAIAIPAFVQARDMSMGKSCQCNQRMIESAKEQVSMEQNLTAGVTITEENIGEYIKGGFSAVQCPEQGVYTINPIGTHTECSVHNFPE